MTWSVSLLRALCFTSKLKCLKKLKEICVTCQTNSRSIIISSCPIFLINYGISQFMQNMHTHSCFKTFQPVIKKENDCRVCKEESDDKQKETQHEEIIECSECKSRGEFIL